MAEYIKESFAPYLESALDSLIVDQMGALYSFLDIIRSEALECLPQLVCVACHATGSFLLFYRREFLRVLYLNHKLFFT